MNDLSAAMQGRISKGQTEVGAIFSLLQSSNLDKTFIGLSFVFIFNVLVYHAFISKVVYARNSVDVDVF